MNILAFESSAKPVSVALLTDGRVAAAEFENAGLTHSVTLMPMAERVLRAAGLTVADVDCFAVAAGPGSFTGLRIGAGTVKGLAWAAEKPCAAVSTLRAMAELHPGFDGIVCCAMDARRSQVYTARFDTSGGKPERLSPDAALSLAELAEQLQAFARPILLVGDGAALAAEYLAANASELSVTIPEGDDRFQHASGVALAAWSAQSGGDADGVAITDAAGLELNYLRLAQAEREKREREAKLAAEKGDGNHA